MAKPKKSGASVKIDGKKAAEGGGAGKRYPEGDYVVKITKTERSTSQNDNPQIKMTLTIQEGPLKGKTIVDYLTLTEKAMWRVGSLLDALGIKYPKKQFTLPLDKLDGKVLGVTLTDDEYNNRTKSKVSDFLDEETARAAADADDSLDEDEEDEDEDTDDDDDEDEDEDLDELDVDEDL